MEFIFEAYREQNFVLLLFQRFLFDQQETDKMTSIVKYTVME